MSAHKPKQARRVSRAASLVQAIDELNREQLDWDYATLAERTGMSVAGVVGAVVRLRAKGILTYGTRMVAKQCLVVADLTEG